MFFTAGLMLRDTPPFFFLSQAPETQIFFLSRAPETQVVLLQLQLIINNWVVVVKTLSIARPMPLSLDSTKAHYTMMMAPTK